MHGNINIGILGCTVHRQMANSGALEAPAPIKTNIKTNVSLLNLHFTKSGPLKMSQDFSSQVFFFPFGSSHGDRFSKRFLRR